MSIIVIALFFLLIYGCYWVVKSVSYNLFYEGMVEESIKEMVKPDALRQSGKNVSPEFAFGSGKSGGIYEDMVLKFDGPDVVWVPLED